MVPQAPNPYAPPTAPQGPPGFTSRVGPCPRCRSPYVDTPSFTWWGGALGPKLFNHAVCRSCKLGFNSKTGKSNTTAIVLYQVIATVIVLGLLLLYYLL